MRYARLAIVVGSFTLVALPLHAQTMTTASVDKFIAGLAAEKPELAKVSAQVAELNGKIKEFRGCFKQLRDAGQVAGVSASGFKAKAIVRARCGTTSEDGWLEERGRLLESPEKVGASAAGMERADYAQMKEMALLFLGGSRDLPENDIKVFTARATDLSNALGVAYVRVDNSGRSASGGGGGGAMGVALAGQPRMFTPDMTWAYVSYLHSMLYMSGATMFEADYKAGEWTRWEIADASQSDSRMVLERAMLRRDADKSEWWRTKSITISAERADTIVLETQMKPLDADGLTMQVVRMRGRFPGDTEGKELMVPENMSTLSAAAFGRKPTKESIAGATVGTETVTAGGKAYSASHVKFGAGQGSMNWWLTDKAPGGVVKVAFSGGGSDQTWTMNMTGAGTGARSELGMK